MLRYAKIIWFFLIHLQCIPIYVDCTRISYTEILANEHIKQKLQLLEPKTLLKNFNQSHLRHDLSQTYLSHVSKVCAQALAAYEQGIRKRELWALQMMDSSSKVSSGILWGNLIDVGVYDECIEANNKHFENNDEIRGQHCMYSIDPMISLGPKLPFNHILSICMPEKCNSDDLAGLINKSIDQNSELSTFRPSVSYAACTKTYELHIDKEFIIFVVIMGLYIGFLSLCTILDLWNRSNHCRNNSRTMQNLIQFSYLENTKAIFSMNFGDGDLPTLHGLRALNTFSLVLLHEYLFHMMSPLTNFSEWPAWFVSWKSLIPLVCIYCVDTFLVLSGFLTAFAFFKERAKNKKFNILSYYFHRILRVAPLIIAIVYINIVLVPKIPVIISGPRMNWLLDLLSSGCRSKWPSIIFFYQNFVEQDNYCLQNLWQISVEMQLFWISPFILYVLWKTPKIGVSILVTLFTASVASYAIILGINKYSAIYFVQNPNIATILNAFHDIYEVTYTRASPWLLGIFLGYIMQEKCLKSKPIIDWLGWFITAASIIFCVIGIKTFTNEDYEYNLSWEIAFAALSKPLWGFITCWIIYSTINYPNGPLARILSLKFFLPFSRLSYATAAIHCLFPFLRAGSLKVPIYLSDYAVMESFISNMVFISLLATAVSITFEIPIRNLEKVISDRNKVKPEGKHVKN